ncbi:hypothetical protein QVD17_12143 [Tagetes erecta]|uniref:Uncharacterized protein n=1 Tax=Tagetes erecta TaxID=13708 RepID=A0AAD8KZ86_TARER|nr:hypothetical protein QVD17_12143 [Tagetes erecta]
MQSIQCDEPHRELLCCGTHRPEVSHEVSFELQGTVSIAEQASTRLEDITLTSKAKVEEEYSMSKKSSQSTSTVEEDPVADI